MKKRLISLLVFFTCSNGFTQMVGTNAYMVGNYVEIGIDGTYGYEGVDTFTSPPPAGTHYRSNTQYFGFVANPQMNAWSGSSYDGDFFTPGSPENGWGFELIDAAFNSIRASNNRSFGSGILSSGGFSYQQTGTCIIVDHYSNYVDGSGWDISFHIDYYLDINDLYYTTTVTVTNNSLMAIPDFYYYRNFDPDNNITISGDYTTLNTNVSQPGTGCNKAHVSATAATPWNSYVGIAGVGTKFRVAHGGFSNRDASNIWDGVAGLDGTVGGSTFSDEAIAIAYRIQNMQPGASETFKYVIILDDAASNNAINNLFYFDYVGSTGGPPPECVPDTDTASSCSGGSVNISIMGSALSDFNWTWSPATGLSSTTGTTVTASPFVTTTYTVTGTPINPCFNTITQSIVVYVDCTILPVELLEYTATPFEDVVNLNWKTATEINNDYFIIEKSTNGIDYTPMAKVDVAANSNSVANYGTVDIDPANGVNYYKLSTVDIHGNTSELGVRAVVFNSDEEFNVDLVQVYDLSGQLLISEKYSGNELFKFYQTLSLSQGIYLVKLVDKNNRVKSQYYYKQID